MKKHLRNLVILIVPFVLMVVVNETSRLTIKEIPYSNHGITAINSVDNNTNKCTWICHNNTSFCKANHVKYLKNHFSYTDTIYFGIIGLLAKTGNYGLANIIFLVILLPLLIWLFIIASLNTQNKINNLK